MRTRGQREGAALMDCEKAFREILEKTAAIALDDIPNVRIVNFCFDEKRPGVLLEAIA
jgi:hypothetical protein